MVQWGRWGTAKGSFGEAAGLDEVSQGVRSLPHHRTERWEDLLPLLGPLQLSHMYPQGSQCLDTCHPSSRRCTLPEKLKTEMITTESRQVRTTGFVPSPPLLSVAGTLPSSLLPWRVPEAEDWPVLWREGGVTIN